MYHFAKEDVNFVKKEMSNILPKHWEEVIRYQDKLKLAPDYATYEMLERNGQLLLLTVRDNDYKLVGYVTFVITNSLHEEDTKVAQQDTIYLSKETRGHGVADELLQHAEIRLRGIGVTFISMSMPYHKPFEGLLDRQGFEPHEIVYSKYIG